MFQLFVGESKNHVPIAPVRWCLGKELIRELSDAGAQNPHIMLSIFYNDGSDEVDDQVIVPLTQVMTFVEFNCPGHHRIEADIIWWDPAQLDSLRILRDPKTDSHYEINYVREAMRSHERTREVFLRNHKKFFFHREIAVANVTVDEGFFAGDPPKWERRWVNFWFSHKPKDQCEFRRRRILAYTVQPFALLFWVMISFLLRSVGALLWFIIGKRVNLAPIVHPFQDSLKDVEYHGNGRDFFLYDIREERRPFGFWLLYPMNWVVAGLVVGALYVLPLEFYNLSLIFAKVVVILGLTGIIVKLLANLLGERLGRINAELKRKEEERIRTEAEDAFRKLYEEELVEVSCDGSEKRPSLSSIRRPSARLRFEAIKARVCKPYRWS